MDDEDFYLEEDDEGVEDDCSDEDDENDFGLVADHATGGTIDDSLSSDSFTYKALSPEAIAQSMLDSLEEVNEVFQVCSWTQFGISVHFLRCCQWRLVGGCFRSHLPQLVAFLPTSNGTRKSC